MRRLHFVPFVLAALVSTALAVPAVGQAPPRHFLWKVTAPTGAEAYLLGSVHALTRSFYPLSPVIEQAFAASRVLVEEIDLEEMANPATMLALAGKAMLPPDQSLEGLLSKDTYAAVVARAGKHGVPVAVLQRMKPWMVAVTLTAAELSASGFDAANGIDRHFFDRAVASGMPRRALETVAYQFDRLDGLPRELQESSLRAMFTDIDAQAANIEELARAWRAGEVATLERILHEGFAEAPALTERLLLERNRNWVPEVERCLAEQARCFIVVGAGHLVGPGSLVELLRARKLVVEQQ